MKPALLLAVATLSGVASGQATTTLTSDRDNTLYGEGGASNGAGTRMFTGFRSLDGALRRAVVRFDVAGAIPAGATILAVELDVTVVQTIVGAYDQELHRATSDWGEGTSFAASGQGFGAAPTAGDTTWSERMFPGTLWATPGGDFVPAASSTVAAGAQGTYTFPSTAALVADVQAWVDTPATNFGWFILGEEDLSVNFTTAKAIATHEDASNAPVLRVTHTVPASATAYGTSCAAVAPPLVLSAQSVPALGTTTFALSVAGGGTAVNRVDCLFSREALGSALPILGCELWIDPATILPVCVPFDPNGLLAIDVPNDPALEGERFAAQAAGTGPGLASITTSNGLELVIGR